MAKLLKIIGVVLLVAMAAACGSDAEPTVVATETPSDVDDATAEAATPVEIDTSRITETWDTPGDNEIQLLVSNQSLIHETVRITIEVDGEPVIDQAFDAGDQHNFFSFNVNAIEPGEHTITMRSDTDTELERTFTKTDAPIWMIVHYWFDEYESKKFTFELSNEPVEFA